MMVFGEAAIAGDRHAAGRLAASRALAQLDPAARLAYDGPRPIVVGVDAAVSITHGTARALAVAARVPALGIDLCSVDDRLAALVDRYLAGERALATTPWACAACLAAKEAGLKALGLGLLDGGMFDGACPIRVASLDPPRLADSSLALRLETARDGAVAIVWRVSARV